jgi:hypothetical protein
MSADRDVTPALRSWLHEDAHENADRVLDLVFAELDTTPQRRAGWLARRFPPMNNAVRIGLAAVAVLVIAFLGIRFLGPGNTGGPVATPTPAPLPSSGPLAAGSYVMTANAPVPFTFTVPAGWSLSTDGFVIKHKDGPGEVAFTSWEITHIFGDACHWKTTVHAVAGTNLDTFASSLAGQKEQGTTGPTDVTFAGYPAKRVDLAEPAGFDASACDDGITRPWPDVGGALDGGWRARPGQTDEVYMLDVKGKRVVIDAYHFTTTSEADITEMEEIIASIHFTP